MATTNAALIPFCMHFAEYSLEMLGIFGVGKNFADICRTARWNFNYLSNYQFIRFIGVVKV